MDFVHGQKWIFQGAYFFIPVPGSYADLTELRPQQQGRPGKQVLGTLNARRSKGVQTLSSQRKMFTTLGYITPWKKPPKFQKVVIVCTILS